MLAIFEVTPVFVIVTAPVADELVLKPVFVVIAVTPVFVIVTAPVADELVLKPVFVVIAVTGVTQVLSPLKKVAVDAVPVADRSAVTVTAPVAAEFGVMLMNVPSVVVRLSTVSNGVSINIKSAIVPAVPDERM